MRGRAGIAYLNESLPESVIVERRLRPEFRVREPVLHSIIPAMLETSAGAFKPRSPVLDCPRTPRSTDRLCL